MITSVFLVGCGSHSSYYSYFATPKSYAISGQQQVSGSGDIELALKPVVEVETAELSLLVKNVLGEAIEVLPERCAVVIDDTVVIQGPFLYAGATDHYVERSSTSRSRVSRSSGGAARYPQWNSPKYQTEVLSSEWSSSSEEGTTYGVLKKGQDAVTIYPDPAVVSMFLLMDPFLQLMRNTVVKAPDERGGNPRYDFSASWWQLYDDDDIVDLGVPILEAEVNTFAAQHRWSLIVSYRKLSDMKVRFARLDYEPGNAAYDKRKR